MSSWKNGMRWSTGQSRHGVYANSWRTVPLEDDGLQHEIWREPDLSMAPVQAHGQADRRTYTSTT